MVPLNVHFISRMISHLGVGSWLMKNYIWLGKVPFIQNKDNTIILFKIRTIGTPGFGAIQFANKAHIHLQNVILRDLNMAE